MKKKISVMAFCMVSLVYILALAKLVVFKNGFTTQFRSLNILPFHFVLDYLNGNSALSVILKNVLGNIGVFMPLGILLPVLSKKTSAKKAVFIGFLISLTIEALQYIVGFGITDIDDLMLNTVGIALGVLLYTLLTKRLDKKYGNYFASTILMCFIGFICAFLLYFFGYGSNLTPAPCIEANQEVLAGLDPDTPNAEIWVESLVDTELSGFSSFPDAEGSNAINYKTTTQSKFYTKTISCEYSPNGNVTKVIATYAEVTKDDISELIHEKSRWISIWTQDNTHCDALMTTVYIE